MQRSDLLDVWVSYADVSRELGISSSNVTQWAEHGIPLLQQMRIEVLTGGKLTADRKALSERYPEVLDVWKRGVKEARAPKSSAKRA